MMTLTIAELSLVVLVGVSGSGKSSCARMPSRPTDVLASPEEVDAAVVERQPLWNNRKHDHGPFDIIGDVHGCFEELRALLEQLEYRLEVSASEEGASTWTVVPPEGRKAVFLGDLV